MFGGTPEHEELCLSAAALGRLRTIAPMGWLRKGICSKSYRKVGRPCNHCVLVFGMKPENPIV